MFPAIEVDLRRASPADHISKFFRAFDGLHPGESLVLLSDRDPVPLLRVLHAARPDLFDWTPLEPGPQEYAVEIHRRTDGRRRGVEEFLQWEHRHLDTLLSEVEWRLEQRMFRDATRRFGHFRSGLERHMDMEERFAFPLYEEVSEAGDEPTRELRAEHAVMRRLVQQIASTLGYGEGASARAMADIGVLREIQGPHAVTEGRVIYPILDRASAPDGALLVHRMQEI